MPPFRYFFIAQLLACGGILSGFGIPFKWGCDYHRGCYFNLLYHWRYVGRCFNGCHSDGCYRGGHPPYCLLQYCTSLSRAAVPSRLYATPFIPEGMGSKFIYLVLPFLLSISVSYDAYTRIQSAKDAKTARLGCIIERSSCNYYWNTLFIHRRCGCQPFPRCDRRYLYHCSHRCTSPVLAGIVIAAILSAAMSSANCVILSMGTSFSRDFYNKFLHPEVDNLDSLPQSKEDFPGGNFIGSIVGILFAFKMTDILDAMIIFNYPYGEPFNSTFWAAFCGKGSYPEGCVCSSSNWWYCGCWGIPYRNPGSLNGLMNTDLALMFAYLISLITLVIVSLTDKRGPESQCPAADEEEYCKEIRKFK